MVPKSQGPADSMGIAEAIAACAKLLETILTWIKGGTAKSTEQKVEDAKSAVQSEDKDFQKTGRPDG